jgi:hypothetical protein
MSKLLKIANATIAAVLMSFIFLVLFLFALTDPIPKMVTLDTSVFVSQPFHS